MQSPRSHRAPSNTLSCLNSLTEDVVRSGEFGPVEVRVEVIDEIVSRVDPRALGRRYRRDGTKVVVGLVGVQTNQFPGFPIERRWPFARRRAREMAHQVREHVRLRLEMRELWLLTRIRRDDYWFLGNLRRVGPRSVQVVKLTWGRVHAAVALRQALGFFVAMD